MCVLLYNSSIQILTLLAHEKHLLNQFQIAIMKTFSIVSKLRLFELNAI